MHSDILSHCRWKEKRECIKENDSDVVDLVLSFEVVPSAAFCDNHYYKESHNNP